MPSTRFESLGLYLPSTVVTTGALIDRMNYKPGWDLEKRTGIRARRFRSPSESSYSIALKAAEDCLRNSKYRASDLDVIVFTSITRFTDGLKYLYEPAMSLLLKNSLGAGSAMNFDISNACAGMFTGAYLLESMISTGAVRRGMIVSGECISPISDTAVREVQDRIDDQFASLTVGDAGAAFILDQSSNPDEGIEFVDFVTAADCAEMCIGKPSVRNAGPAMYTQVIDLQDNLLKTLPVLLEKMFRRVGRDFTNEHYDQIIPHQVSPTSVRKNLENLRQHFAIDIPSPAFISSAEFGNTASTSHIVVLYHVLKSGGFPKNALSPDNNGNRVLLLPFASGQVIGCLSAKLGPLEFHDENRSSVNRDQRSS